MDKKIRYSQHALQRKFERDITDDEITKTLDEPDYTLTSIEERKIVVKKIGDRTIRIVYKEEKDYIIIITVY